MRINEFLPHRCTRAFLYTFLFSFLWMKIEHKYIQYNSVIQTRILVTFFFSFLLPLNQKRKKKIPLFKTRMINFSFFFYYIRFFYSEFAAGFHLKAHKLEDFWNLNAIFYIADFSERHEKYSVPFYLTCSHRLLLIVHHILHERKESEMEKKI